MKIGDQIGNDGHWHSSLLVLPLRQCATFNLSRAGAVYMDDVIKLTHFPRYWSFMRGIQRSPVNSPHKGQWRGALTFSLICAWINSWVNYREAGDLRFHRAHYGVIVMICGIRALAATVPVDVLVPNGARPLQCIALTTKSDIRFWWSVAILGEVSRHLEAVREYTELNQDMCVKAVP